jgi:hypothetical protein
VAAEVIIDLRGIDETLRRLGQPEVLREAIGFSAQTALEPVVENARALASRRSGKMSKSIRLQTRHNIEQVEVTLGTGVPYGHLIEKGHFIVPRGPSRRGLGKPRDDTAEQAKQRRQLRSGLRERQERGLRAREQGLQGFVKARAFAEPAYRAHEGAVRDVFEQSMFTILGLS